jgi:hypothetical protein
MIWIALLLGIFLGWLAHEVTGFIFLHPMASVEKYKEENTHLKSALLRTSDALESLMGVAREQMKQTFDENEQLVALLAEVASLAPATLERCERCGSVLPGQRIADAGDDEHNRAG